MMSIRTSILTICLALAASFSVTDEDPPDLQSEIDSLQHRLNEIQLGYANLAQGLDSEEKKEAFFAKAALPILEARCFKCHTESKQKGELRLDSLAFMLEGGETEPAIVPGKPEESLLVRAIRRTEKLKMPKKGELSQGEIDVLTAWVAIGAPWPELEATPAPDPAHVPVAKEKARAKEVPKIALTLDKGEPVSFKRDIRPILSDKCSACHGPDHNKREANLRLDREAEAFGALPSGRRAIVPGDLEASQIFQRIAAHDEDDVMPPSDFAKSLTQDQIKLIGRWILQGAQWESHWAFEAPKRPLAPAVNTGDFPRNDIDRFVLATIEAQGLTPNVEADRRTLIRRLTLDLTGLPPTLSEINAFVNDTHIDAYEQVVDRLLASPRYGEHMTRSWLDIARYADTNGYHIDNERTMWRWRDWVIDAYNSNKPFDEFTIEQLAGDLLENPTESQRIATGFNRNHMVNFEGGAIPEEYRIQYVSDRVDTTATTWLGLTMACAKCHEHKYDPITQKEYYQLFAFFNTIDEAGLDGNTPSGNARPLIQAPYAAHKDRLAKINDQLNEATSQLYRPEKKLDKSFDKWVSNWSEKVAHHWNTLTPISTESANGSTLSIQQDHSVLAAGEVPATEIYTIEAETKATTIRAIQLETLVDESFNDKLGRSSNGNFILTEFEVEYADPEAPDQYTKVKFTRAKVDIEQSDFKINSAIDGNAGTGWAPNGHGIAGQRTAVFVASKPFGYENGTKLRIKLAQENAGISKHLIGRFRLAVTEDPSWGVVVRNPWQISGPFRAIDQAGAEAKDFVLPETLDLDGSYPDGRAKWSLLFPETPENTVREIVGGLGASYFYRNLESPVARTLELKLGAGESLKIWLNGEVVLEPDDQKTLRKNEFMASIDLKQGRNDILMKVTSFGAKSRFLFDIMKEEVGALDYKMLVLLAKSKDDWTASEKETAQGVFRSEHWDQWDELSAVVAKLEKEKTQLEKETPMTMVMGEMATPRKTFILNRGDYDSPLEEVSANTPAFLGSLPEDAPKNRLSLARWLVSGDNPLTARVTVNRMWTRFFGAGLVKTPEDFGSQGQWPTHPELLDWLASEFVESGWDVKGFQRLILTSATYKQSSKSTKSVFAKDPENRYLTRASRFRVDAEVVRDSALAISGLLVHQQGGKSVLPYQPPGLWQEVGYGGNFTAQVFKQDEGDGLYRRSMYTFWKRTAPPPSMMVFDAPNRETCTVQRGRSNTPLQALTLMNDPQFVEAARALAERVLVQGGDSTTERINFAFELATAREVSEEELSILREIYETQVQRFNQEDSGFDKLLEVGDSGVNQQLDQPVLAAWSVVTSMILNLDETITRN